jgi:two-component system response regulator FixJ
MSPENVVHVVDDDEGVRESLSLLLKSNRIPSRAHANAEALLSACPGLTASCVVTDIRLPGMSGLELLDHLAQVGKGNSVILLTGHGDIRLAVEAMKRGADDFVEKPINGALMIASIRAGLSRVHREYLREAERAEALERIRRLSSQERAVLDGLLEGKPNKVIAFELSISPRTVETYRAHVMTKMQVASLSNLVRLTLLATSKDH